MNLLFGSYLFCRNSKKKIRQPKLGSDPPKIDKDKKVPAVTLVKVLKSITWSYKSGTPKIIR